MAATAAQTQKPTPPMAAFPPDPFLSPENGGTTEFSGLPTIDSSASGCADTTDDSLPHSAISPVARKILLGADDDLFDDLEFGDESNNEHKSPLAEEFPLEMPFDDREVNGTTNLNYRRERQDSFPDVEELKLSVAAAGKSSVSSSLLSERKRQIGCMLFSLVMGIIALIAFVAIAIDARKNRHQTTSIDSQNHNKNSVENLDDSGSSTLVFDGKGTSVGKYDDREVHLKNYFARYGIVEEINYQGSWTAAMNTPQSEAIAWLANEDTQFPVLPTHNEGPDTPQGYKLLMRYAMAVLYFATDGENWKNDLHFLDAEKPTCDWFQVFPPPMGQVGVLCNQNTQEIVGLSLISNNLVGTLPAEISLLTSLTYLESIENELGGTIPYEWHNLQNLRTLIMGFSQLTGTLPSWMPLAWPNLEYLYLSNNELSGFIPDEFFGFQKLSILALDDNLFTGRTDVIWNSLHSLEHLYIEDNGFTGTLPNLIAKSHPALVTLDISSNRLNGSLPDDLFRLPKLEILDVHSNHFTSSIPEDVPENNQHLKFLALYRNDLKGSIPSAIANLRHLSHLDLSSNYLTGTIPAELEKLSDTLTYLFLGANDYNEGPIPSFVYDMTNLRELSLKSTHRTGTISGVIGALESLLVLDLDDNKLSGSIPDQIGMLTNLQFLLLNRNQLTSSVPSHALAKLEKLRVLLLDNNRIFGDLNPICGLDDLTTVFVDCGEVACLEGCCFCCLDGQVCHNYDHIASHDPLWEGDYKRQFFDFSSNEENGNGGRYYPNRDDDYW